jgi:hypothetical protein
MPGVGEAEIALAAGLLLAWGLLAVAVLFLMSRAYVTLRKALLRRQVRRALGVDWWEHFEEDLAAYTRRCRARDQ